MHCWTAARAGTGLPARTTIYYTFSLAAPNPNAGGSITGATSAFNATQQAAAVSALAVLTQITGIAFALTADANQADLHFCAADIIEVQSIGLCSWSSSYSISGNTITSYRADAWIYLDNVNHAAGTSACHRRAPRASRCCCTSWATPWGSNTPSPVRWCCRVLRTTRPTP
ncbi:MAG: hypothetical protein U1E77_12155 [Inhella sp.]